MSLTPITSNSNGLYYQQSQPDVQLHQDGQGHKLESVEGLLSLYNNNELYKKRGQ
jgi:hypothetical protein